MQLAARAFINVYEHVTFLWGTQGGDNLSLSDECKSIGRGACTSSSHLINFASMWSETENRGSSLTFQLQLNNVVHEIGHAFGARFAKNGPYQSINSFENSHLRTNRGLDYPGPTYATDLWGAEYKYRGNEVLQTCS